MASIEEVFHTEIDNIKTFSGRNHQAISKYCLLWKLRHEHHISSSDDTTLYGITGSILTKEQEEVLESKGVMFVREGGIVPSRFGSGFQIQMALDRDWHICSHFKWGIIEATEGEYIVADSYGDFPFLPITPKLAFWAGESDRKIDKKKLANINKISIQRAIKFYFARKLSEGPIA